MSTFSTEIENYIFSFLHKANEEQNMKAKEGWWFSNIVLPQLLNKAYWNLDIADILINHHDQIKEEVKYISMNPSQIINIRPRFHNGIWRSDFMDRNSTTKIDRLLNLERPHNNRYYQLHIIHDELLYSDKIQRFRRRLGLDLIK